MNGNPVSPQSYPSRRRFLRQTVAAASLGALGRPALLQGQTQPHSSPAELPSAFDNLAPLGSRVHPITPAEFSERIAHAQQLMADPTSQAADASSKPPQKYDALFFAPGTSLYYFTGVHWGLSERLLGLVIPREGTPIMVVPGFEEGRLRERLHVPMEIHAWQEDESPTQLAAQALADRGIRSGRIGVEETAGFTFFDHFRRAAPGFEFISADPVTIACRGRKSAHELELMRLACDATFDVFRAVFASLKEGMSQDDIGRWIEEGFAKMNLQGGALVLDRRLSGSASRLHQAANAKARRRCLDRWRNKSGRIRVRRHAHCRFWRETIRQTGQSLRHAAQGTGRRAWMRLALDASPARSMTPLAP